MGQIRTDIREKLMQTLFGVASKDAEKIVDSLVELGALVPTGDMGPVRRSIQYMLDNFMDKPFEAQSITAISDDLYDIAYDQPFRFPATFTFVMRAFSTLEGVGKGLDPEFNFMEVAQPFAIQIMNDGNLANTSNTIFNEIGRQAAQVSSSAFSLPGRIENAIDKLEQGDIRVRVRATETDRLIRRLGNAQLSTTYALLITGFTGSATALFLYDKTIPAGIFLGMAVIVAVFLLKLLRKMERFDKIL